MDLEVRLSADVWGWAGMRGAAGMQDAVKIRDVGCYGMLLLGRNLSERQTGERRGLWPGERRAAETRFPNYINLKTQLSNRQKH